MRRWWKVLGGLSNTQDFSCMQCQEIFSGESQCSRGAFRLDSSATKEDVQCGPNGVIYDVHTDGPWLRWMHADGGDGQLHEDVHTEN